MQPHTTILSPQYLLPPFSHQSLSLATRSLTLILPPALSTRNAQVRQALLNVYGIDKVDFNTWFKNRRQVLPKKDDASREGTLSMEQDCGPEQDEPGLGATAMAVEADAMDDELLDGMGLLDEVPACAAADGGSPGLASDSRPASEGGHSNGSQHALQHRLQPQHSAPAALPPTMIERHGSRACIDSGFELLDAHPDFATRAQDTSFPAPHLAYLGQASAGDMPTADGPGFGDQLSMGEALGASHPDHAQRQLKTEAEQAAAAADSPLMTFSQSAVAAMAAAAAKAAAAATGLMPSDEPVHGALPARQLWWQQGPPGAGSASGGSGTAANAARRPGMACSQGDVSSRSSPGRAAVPCVPGKAPLLVRTCGTASRASGEGIIAQAQAMAAAVLAADEAALPNRASAGPGGEDANASPFAQALTMVQAEGREQRGSWKEAATGAGPGASAAAHGSTARPPAAAPASPVLSNGAVMSPPEYSGDDGGSLGLDADEMDQMMAAAVASYPAAVAAGHEPPRAGAMSRPAHACAADHQAYAHAHAARGQAGYGPIRHAARSVPHGYTPYAGHALGHAVMGGAGGIAMGYPVHGGKAAAAPWSAYCHPPHDYQHEMYRPHSEEMAAMQYSQHPQHPQHLHPHPHSLYRSASLPSALHFHPYGRPKHYMHAPSPAHPMEHPGHAYNAHHNPATNGAPYPGSAKPRVSRGHAQPHPPPAPAPHSHSPHAQSGRQSGGGSAALPAPPNPSAGWGTGQPSYSPHAPQPHAAAGNQQATEGDPEDDGMQGYDFSALDFLDELCGDAEELRALGNASPAPLPSAQMQAKPLAVRAHA